MGTFLAIYKDNMIFLNSSTTIKYFSSYVRHVLAKASVFVLDLKRELSRVAKDNNRYVARSWFYLLQRRQDKDRSLPHTRLSLAEHVHTQNRLWDTLLLY